MSRTRVSAELRRLVRRRANGSCEDCLAPEALSFALHQVDHIEAEKHGGLTAEGNLALCCVICNQFKGTDLSSLDPLTQQLTPLFNRRKDRWAEHFQLERSHIIPLSPVGRATSRLLHFNDPEALSEREFFIAAGFFGVQKPL
jgi:HNH endonuclease